MATKGIDYCQILTTTLLLTPPRAITVANIRTSFTKPETRIPSEHFRRSQYGSIFIRFHTVVSQSEGEKSSQTDDENIFSNKWHFKVIQGHSKHFKITGKPIMHFMRMHNNIGFNWKGPKDMAIEITKHCRY